MRLLDLFCGAGGAAMGYHRAGFDHIVGVDNKVQPRYPFEFVQADALEYVRAHGHEFNAIHASPPCQAFTLMSVKHRGRSAIRDGHPDLLSPTRDILTAMGTPYVIENVPGAKNFMRPTMILHGGMFGLGVHRPRLFETSFLVLVSLAKATKDPIGVYGSHPGSRHLWTRTDGSRLRRAGSISEASNSMGISHMKEWREVCEAIPPAYTEFIGKQLLQHLGAS